MLLPILGTSWVFGVLAVNSQAVVFQYAFTVLNSLQVGAWGLRAGSLPPPPLSRGEPVRGIACPQHGLPPLVPAAACLQVP